MSDTLKKYSIKEVFYTLQGEGLYAGRPAVFCRFSGCNFWTGLEKDRKNAICHFCDTDFKGINGKNGGKFDSDSLGDLINSIWPMGKAHKFVVCTGGEPLLQLDKKLIDAFHALGFEIAVETNGSVLAPEGIDWLTVSPKDAGYFKQRSGNELKLVFPQKSLTPGMFDQLPFEHFFLQPMDGPELASNTKAALRYCLENPPWKLSLQTHKILGIE
ncbi:MAG TPA: 7-carboxy-7-deazaguanine synthase [Saprospirales bacterium]|nr:7-carboxy-7-deazaguanine synthase [Saprospirales bacterium]HAY70392.1 7-carboxy-7-deazaguanine synthase [Saprospirales bacterium]HRQ29889.1 7-carboxy-7-deazaguanine synthase [Saprospiraceae bacterium]